MQEETEVTIDVKDNNCYCNYCNGACDSIKKSFGSLDDEAGRKNHRHDDASNNDYFVVHFVGHLMEGTTVKIIYSVCVCHKNLLFHQGIH